MQTFIVILTAFFAFGLPILVFEASNGKGKVSLPHSVHPASTG